MRYVLAVNQPKGPGIQFQMNLLVFKAAQNRILKTMKEKIFPVGIKICLTQRGIEPANF